MFTKIFLLISVVLLVHGQLDMLDKEDKLFLSYGMYIEKIQTVIPVTDEWTHIFSTWNRQECRSSFTVT